MGKNFLLPKSSVVVPLTPDYVRPATNGACSGLQGFCMSSFLFRCATSDNLNFIIMLCRHSCNVKEEGLGYPRFEESTELLSELELYNNTLENCLYIITTEDGEPIGTTGFLFEPGERKAYLIGPLLSGSWRTPTAMRAALSRIETISTDMFDELHGSVANENTMLIDAMNESGWERKHEQIEMKCIIPPAVTKPGLPDLYQIQPLQTPDDSSFVSIANLLGTSFKWKDDCEQRLDGYLEEDYKVAFTQRDGVVLGCAIWIYLKDTDFGRLDYIAVQPAWRRRHIGSTLLAYVLEDACFVGVNSMFLSMDPSNEAAHQLYLQHGFFDNLRSTIFNKKHLS